MENDRISRCVRRSGGCSLVAGAFCVTTLIPGQGRAHGASAIPNPGRSRKSVISLSVRHSNVIQ